MNPRYVVRKHEDHWHVIDSTDDHPVLDDRPYNPWRYARRKDAAAVATLLSRGVSAFEIRLMDMDEIHAATDEQP